MLFWFKNLVARWRLRKMLRPAGADATLVVVDMQPYFAASQDANTITAVERLILNAIEKEQGIVVLEYKGDGDTDERLMRHLRGRYARHTVAQKNTNDGSAEVVRACKFFGYDMSRFIVCGVNTDACVLATVSGLSKRIPEATVEVVRAGCNQYGRNQWDGYANLRGVVLV